MTFLFHKCDKLDSSSGPFTFALPSAWDILFLYLVFSFCLDCGSRALSNHTEVEVIEFEHGEEDQLLLACLYPALCPRRLTSINHMNGLPCRPTSSWVCPVGSGRMDDIRRREPGWGIYSSGLAVSSPHSVLSLPLEFRAVCCHNYLVRMISTLELKPQNRWPIGNSLVVQWLGLSALTAEAPCLIPGWGTKIPQAGRCGKKKNTKIDGLYIFHE